MKIEIFHMIFVTLTTFPIQTNYLFYLCELATGDILTFRPFFIGFNFIFY